MADSDASIPERPATIAGLPVPSPEPYINRKELAAIMSVSLSTIDQMRREGLPFVTWGRRTVRFRASAALAWAQERERPTLSCTQSDVEG
jgi:predicted DNA-binding transcriptional regulator AlpA